MRYDVPVFDPFGDRGDDYYHPANDAAEHLMQIAFTHRDIALLFCLLGRAESKHEQKLLTKFIVVEFLSLDEHLRKLVGLALFGKTGYPLDDAQSVELKRLNGAYTSLQKPAERVLREVRNKVAAHRDGACLLATARIWDGIDPKPIHGVLRPVVPLLDFLKDLNIYKWTKSEITEQGQVTAFISPLVWGDVVPELSESSHVEGG